jgi:hypothetical protein
MSAIRLGPEREGYPVNLCYCDESGTGSEPIAVMTGIVVDASRMHLTKQHWSDLLAMLSRETGRQIVELHTRDFYAGNGVFRDIPGRDRTHLFNQIFQWLCDRKHQVVYVAGTRSYTGRRLQAATSPTS